MPFSEATRSFSNFALSVLPISAPLPSIGLEAPIRVVGAIAATGAARVTNAPAEAAKPPAGETYVIIGTVLLSSASVMEFSEARSPPGVLTSITSACDPSPSAVAMAFLRKLNEAGLISLFHVIISTCGDAALAVRADRVPNKETTTTMRALKRRRYK